MSGEKPRQIAARILKRHAVGKDFIEDLVSAELDSVPAADRGLVQELTYGVVRWQATLDWLIARKTEGRTQKVDLQILLRLGLYQMFWLSRVPDHAVVNVTVAVAKRLGHGPQAGFVNAILRSYSRERDVTVKELEALKQTNPPIGYSHPEWLWTRWSNRYGREKTIRLLEWNNSPPPTFARVNTLKVGRDSVEPPAGGFSAALSEDGSTESRPTECGSAGTPRPTCVASHFADSLLTLWTEEGVQFREASFDWIPAGLVYELTSHPPLASLRSFQKGWFYIQDPSTLLATAVVDPQPGDTILDLCAAPGGKTTMLAQLMENSGQIIATDVSAARLKLIEENAQRLGATCITTQLISRNPVGRDSVERSSAVQLDSWDTMQFERILLDVPCSNTGVMRRRVDLRWRIQPDEITRLAAIQLDLLQRAAPRLKPGGTLVYSTCSLEPEENAALIEQFLSRNPKFRLDSERTLLPFDACVDGAYVARFGKES